MSEFAQMTSHAPDGATEHLRVPPHSIHAEQSVLGGLLLDNESWDQIAGRLSEDDFYRADHRLIFTVIRDMADRSNPYDVVTLSDRLGSIDKLQEAGGLAYLGELAQNTPSAANIRSYADIVRERSVLRQLAKIGTEITSSAFATEGRDAKDLLDEAERKVFKIAEQTSAGSKEGFIRLSSLLGGAVDRIEKLFQSEEAITGVSTGYTDLDNQTSGLQKSDLIIIAGRPSMGKTSFAMNIAENIAIEAKRPVAVFSMEMSGEQLAMRLMASLGRIDSHRVRTGKLNDDEWPRLTSAVSLLSEAPLFIDDTPALTPGELRARTRRLAREHGQLACVVIDYLQLMQVKGMGENRTAEISEISRSLKSLARELDCPVVALSQLNRNLEQRPNKRPVMSDLRESGSIEQDADIVMFIYRDEVYNEETAEKGMAEIIIAKQRNGPIGTIRLTFLGQYTRFENFIDTGYGDAPY